MLNLRNIALLAVGVVLFYSLVMPVLGILGIFLSMKTGLLLSTLL